MIFRVRPIRPENPGSPRTGVGPWGGENPGSPRTGVGPWGGEGDAFPTGEAMLGRLPGAENASKIDMRLPGEDGKHRGAKSPGTHPMARIGAEGGAGDVPDSSQSGLSPAESAKSNPENAQKPQPSGDDGVPEDMATLVLDKAALGQGPVVRPDPETELLAA